MDLVTSSEPFQFCLVVRHAGCNNRTKRCAQDRSECLAWTLIARRACRQRKERHKVVLEVNYIKAFLRGLNHCLSYSNGVEVILPSRIKIKRTKSSPMTALL
jgi:hypothetical protein